MKVVVLILAMIGLTFSQQVNIQTIHRFFFEKNDGVLTYKTNYAEISKFDFYVKKDTGEVSCFIHKTDQIVSKYTMLSRTITDSTLTCVVRSDAGNYYNYAFYPSRGFIYVYNIVIVQKDPIVTKTDMAVVFVMQPVSINFKDILE